MQPGGPILGVDMRQKFWFEKDGRDVESHARPAHIWSFDFWQDAASYQSWNHIFIIASSWSWNVQFLAIISHHIKNYVYKMVLVITLYVKIKSRSFTSFIRRVGATISLWRPITVFGSTLKITIAVVVVVAVSLVNLALVQIITARECPWVGIITWKRLCATPGVVRNVSTATIWFTDQVK